MTSRVKEILSWYGSDNPGTLANLARLMDGLFTVQVGARGFAADANDQARVERVPQHAHSPTMRQADLDGRGDTRSRGREQDQYS